MALVVCDSPVLPLAVLASLVALSAAPSLPGTDLVALHISNGAKMGPELPKRIKLLNWGENEMVKRDPKNPDAAPTKDVVKVNGTTLAALSINQAALGYDRVALDFDHNSLPTHKNFERGPRKVAGYGVPEVVENDGLYLRDIEYTPTGEAFGREYCDLSPAPLLNAEREVTFLHSAALTGQGAVVGLSFFNADFLTGQQPEAMAVIHEQSTVTSATTTTDGVGDDLRKLLAVLFGVPETASDEDLLAAGKDFVEKLASGTGTGATATDAAVQAMSLPEQLAATNLRLDGIEREGVIADAVREGKIVPASARTLALADLRRIVAELPAGQVPLDGTVALSASASVTAATALPGGTAADIRRACGVSDEVYARHNGITLPAAA